jgi:hypothetical protein
VSSIYNGYLLRRTPVMLHHDQLTIKTTLCSQVQRRINERFGPFHLDLMALPSNVMVDVEGRPLPFFSRFPMPYSTGVNVFAQEKPEGLLYVFPPFGLIPSLLRLFPEWGDIHVVLVVPIFDLVPLWLNILQMFAEHSLPLLNKGDVGSLIIPTRRGYAPSLIPSAFGLSAVKCFSLQSLDLQWRFRMLYHP